MNPSNSESLLLEAPCRLDAVRDASRLLRTFLAANGLGDNELNDWELVTVEAGNNAVLYVPETERHRGVRFLMSAWPESVELCVTDFSIGFDLPDRVQLPEDDSEGGRGLFLLSALTDSVRYVRGRKENFLILRRHRNSRRPVTDVQRDANVEDTLRLMTEELGATYESLSAIFRFSSDLGKTDDSRACAVRWLGELMRVTRTQWYVFRQWDPESEALNVISAASITSLVDEPEMVLRKNADGPHSVEMQAALDGGDIWLDESSAGASMAPLTRIFGSPLSGVAHPIFVGTQLFGVLSIGMFAPRTDFCVSQIKVIHTFADFLGLQLNNEQGRQEAIHHRLVAKELQVAAGIQRSLLPKKLPSFAGFTVTAHSQSAHEVGGDFYDVIEAGTDGALFAIADVMGKGVPAAMFAAMFRTHLRASTELISSPGKMLTRLNRALFADLDGVDMFITAQLVYFDKTSSSITVATAGHYPALLCHGPNDRIVEVSGDGPPLGISRNPAFVEERVQLHSPARLLMLTDGLIEVRNSAGETLGQAAVAEAFLKASRAGSTALMTQEALLHLAARHQGDTPPSDDITFLLLVEGSGS